MELSVKILFAVLIFIIVIILGFVISIWNKQKKNNSCTSESYRDDNDNDNYNYTPDHSKEEHFVLPTITKNEKEWVFSIDSDANQMGSRNLYRIDGLKPHMLCKIVVGDEHHEKILNFISNGNGVVIFGDSYLPVSSIHQKLSFKISNSNDIKEIIGVYGPVGDGKIPNSCNMVFDLCDVETFEKYKKCVNVYDGEFMMYSTSTCDSWAKRCPTIINTQK
jgi:hypothetical protein